MWYRKRKLLSSKFRRAIRWEFWPMWVFYTPLFFYIAFLVLKHRGLSFLNVNPGFKLSGVVGDNKSLALTQFQEHDIERTARFLILTIDDSIDKRIESASDFMQQLGLNFPIILKPNAGQRGQGVEVIRTTTAMVEYIRKSEEDILIQEYIDGIEFGVFYIRWPNEDKGRLFSITAKCFPKLIGDGESTLEKLILENPRSHYMASFLLKLHSDKLSYVPEKKEEFKTVEIGSHCRGSLFLDANHHATPELLTVFDELQTSVDGFFFGRYDIRVPSVEDFEAGKNLKIIELNGVTSEATSIYDPKHGLLHAYKTLAEQWRLAFSIGQYQLDHNDGKKVSLKEFLNFIRVSKV